jgi:hypothetical protein
MNEWMNVGKCVPPPHKDGGIVYMGPVSCQRKAGNYGRLVTSRAGNGGISGSKQETYIVNLCCTILCVVFNYL